MKFLPVLLMFFLVAPLSHAEYKPAPQYGKKKADSYFIQRNSRRVQNTVVVPDDPYAQPQQNNNKQQSPQQLQNKRQQAPVQQQQQYFPPRASQQSPGPHVMALQLGFFVDDKAHRWGKKSNDEDVGQWNLGVTYLLGEWLNSMDLYFRGDLIGYKIDDEASNKLSLNGLITFPDVRSGFPIYFGGGLGLGVFFDQVDDESNLSFDYQLLVGARVLDIYNGIGFIAEAGVKNHVFLTSTGQFNGYFFSLGSVFRF